VSIVGGRHTHDDWHGDWRLRAARPDDTDGLHALAAKPSVYRYLFDGVAPDKEFIARRVTRGVADAANAGFGMWFLESPAVRYAGGVTLQSYPSPGAAELTYLLDPAIWGQGLALRMAWTAIMQAFHSSKIDAVIAGADSPNARSLALMRRLGMRFHKNVRYPLGAGVEYVLHRDDAGPQPKPLLLPIA
jgi:ribosomal-protein-alanine N-acetyltransferase